MGLVHWLIAGIAACGAGSPRDWPEEDKWVSLKNRESVTCPECREIIEREVVNK